ncbi:MAG TPA: TolC family protein [Gallicola sp.]|nr:TolC family protein [Gallicola sp.]
MMFSFIYIALRVPLFDKFATRTNLRMVKAEMQTQSVKILEIEKTLKTEALKIKTDLINLQQKVITANLSVVAHKEAFRFSTEKFNAGKISVYEHLQAKQKLANSQSQSVQAKYELAYKLAVYDYYYR